jgi:hypothetical protein
MLSLDISTEFCCDRVHPEKPDIQFDKSKFFAGRFIYEDESGAIYVGTLMTLAASISIPQRRRNGRRRDLKTVRLLIALTSKHV